MLATDNWYWKKNMKAEDSSRVRYSLYDFFMVGSVVSFGSNSPILSKSFMKHLLVVWLVVKLANVSLQVSANEGKGWKNDQIIVCQRERDRRGGKCNLLQRCGEEKYVDRDVNASNFRHGIFNIRKSSLNIHVFIVTSRNLNCA
jgi:hypothetical protein